MKYMRKNSCVVCLVISAILLTSSFAMPVLAAENTGIETSSVTRSVPGYYKCTGSDVNIRSGPGTQYTIVGTLNYGTKVYVYSISNGWAKISLGGIYRYVEYYGAAEPPVRCGESHLSGLTEPLHFVY